MSLLRYSILEFNYVACTDKKIKDMIILRESESVISMRFFVNFIEKFNTNLRMY